MGNTANNELMERNERGQVTHTCDCDGFEEWFEYDADGNKTYRKNSEGEEWWYNKDGKITHYKDATSKYEKWYTYDDNGKQTSCKVKDGSEAYEIVD